MKTPITILFLCAFAAFSVIVKNELLVDRSPLEALKIGQQMPDFTLADAEGHEFRLNEVTAEKRLVMINFWASWCGPCRIEMPGFEKIYTSKKDAGFTILAINEDEERARADTYLSEKPVSFPVLFDRDSALMKRFGVRALPTTIIVGHDRKIRQVTEGVSEYVSTMIQTYLKMDELKQ